MSEFPSFSYFMTWLSERTERDRPEWYREGSERKVEMLLSEEQLRLLYENNDNLERLLYWHDRDELVIDRHRGYLSHDNVDTFRIVSRAPIPGFENDQPQRMASPCQTPE